MVNCPYVVHSANVVPTGARYSGSKEGKEPNEEEKKQAAANCEIQKAE